MPDPVAPVTIPKSASLAVRAENAFKTRMAKQIRTRVGSAPTDQAVGDIMDTLMEKLIELFTNCFNGGNVTPAQAVERVKNMTWGQKLTLKSQFVTEAKARGLADAKRLAPAAVDALGDVAKTATVQEQLDFAAFMQPMVDDSGAYTMI